MRKLLNIVGRGMMLTGAILIAPFSLTFAHAPTTPLLGTAEWRRSPVLEKIISGITTIVFGIPFVIGFPLMWVGEKIDVK